MTAYMMHDISLAAPNQTSGKQIVWSTDLHLDAAAKECRQRYLESLRTTPLDYFLIGGDISNGRQSLENLQLLAKKIKAPIYFVLGNHDYYHGSIVDIRQQARQKMAPNLHYLTGDTVVELSPQVALVGHDGWSDGRAGNFLNSEISLNDYFLIDELKNLPRDQLLDKLNKLGKEAADGIRKGLVKALKKYPQVIVLTHTPPFQETCLYDGAISDDQWAPHFVCQAMGEVLKEEAGLHPKSQVLVLCGHSHHGADVQILPNLRVLTGHSDLGTPSIQGVIRF